MSLLPITNSGHTFTWDAENRLASVNGTTYVYDAFGRRVKGASNEILYDLDGHPVIWLDATNGNWAYGEIYAGNRHVATYSGGTTNFLHTDWLGNKRVTTSVTGANSETCTGLPFGDGNNCTGTNWSHLNFTDLIHDFESNTEHTLFRQLSTTQGRWLSPDPAGLAVVDPSNPQSWNRYIYVLNNPLRNIDPLGLVCVWDDGSYDHANDPNTGNYSDCTGLGGTWVDNTYFSDLGYTDWSGAPNSDLQNLVQSIRAGRANPSANVYGGGLAYVLESQDAVNAYLGNGPKEIVYGPQDPYVNAFQQSLAMTTITESIRSNGCMLTGRGSIGSWTAFTNSVVDIVANKDNWYNPESQLGAVTFTFTRATGSLQVMVENDISRNSQYLHIPSHLGISDPTSGPNGTVHQTLNIIAKDPC